MFASICWEFCTLKVRITRTNWYVGFVSIPFWRMGGRYSFGVCIGLLWLPYSTYVPVPKLRSSLSIPSSMKTFWSWFPFPNFIFAACKLSLPARSPCICCAIHQCWQHILSWKAGEQVELGSPCCFPQRHRLVLQGRGFCSIARACTSSESCETAWTHHLHTFSARLILELRISV